MSSGAPPPTTSSSGGDFTCSICFDVATEPVVTKCGHLYCWNCLEIWLRRVPECPMCKGYIDEHHPGDIIPLYGKGKSGEHRPTDRSHDPRPAPPSSTHPQGAQPAAGSGEERATGDRPRANREVPFERGLRGAGGILGGGGGLFLFYSPSLVPWPWMLLLIAVVLFVKFSPWRDWMRRLENYARQRIERAGASRMVTEVTTIGALAVLFWLCS